MGKFEIESVDGKHYIIHNDYPRFRGEIVRKEFSDINDIEFYDECSDANLLAKTMCEAGDYIFFNAKELIV